MIHDSPKVNISLKFIHVQTFTCNAEMYIKNTYFKWHVITLISASFCCSLNEPRNQDLFIFDTWQMPTSKHKSSSNLSKRILCL